MRTYEYKGVTIMPDTRTMRVNKTATGFTAPKYFLVLTEGGAVRCKTLKLAKEFIDRVQAGKEKM